MTVTDQEWKMPKWMIPFTGKYIPAIDICEQHMNDNKTNAVTNTPLAMMVVETKGKVQMLQKLHDDGLLKFD